MMKIVYYKKLIYSVNQEYFNGIFIFYYVIMQKSDL